MKKIVFATDLDNTLLYSYKHCRPGDICVEYIKGKEQGYMPMSVYESLRVIADHAEIIPITTRSIDQYKRINWPAGAEPKIAAVTNGSILLGNSALNCQWEENVEASMSELERMQAILAISTDYIRCRMVDNKYLFVYCAKEIDPIQQSKAIQELTPLKVTASGKKIYLFPPGVDKGTATSKIRRFLEPDLLISAGDSDIDLPMLNQADIALVPNADLAAKLHGDSLRQVLICPKEQSFLEFTTKKAIILATDGL
ncbi:HAD hydrolase family protein [bacterium]|nr:HAD hydrolase family protein [bacterium]